MNEDQAHYRTKNATPQTIQAFKNHTCSRASSAGYEPPTPEIVGALIKMAGWSQTKTARLVGVNYTIEKGSPTVRRWKTTSGKSETIPYSAWRLLLLAAGVVEISEDLSAVGANKVAD